MGLVNLGSIHDFHPGALRYVDSLLEQELASPECPKEFVVTYETLRELVGQLANAAEKAQRRSS